MHREPPRAARARFVDRDAAIVAWRCWRLDRSGGTVRLRSPFHASPWPVGEPFVAQCLRSPLRQGARGPRHDVPAPHCRCGAYGGSYRGLRTLLDGTLLRPSTAPVLGRVLLWGGVVEEGEETRATFAYPDRLYVPTLVDDVYPAAAALEAYDVPVTLLDVAETFTALHPTTRLRSLE